VPLLVLCVYSDGSIRFPSKITILRCFYFTLRDLNIWFDCFVSYVTVPPGMSVPMLDIFNNQEL
jgi:hypothetical protein